MTNTRTSRGSMPRILVAGAATAALALGALAATVAPAHAVAPTVTATPANGLAYGGQQITVTGSGYVAGTELYVSVCDTAKPPGSACDLPDAAQVTVAGDGTFSTPLMAKGSFGTTDCLDGTAICGVVTSNKNNGADPAAYGSTHVTFAPVLELSDTWLTPGETVKLKGSHFPSAPTTLYVTICADPPTATNCYMDLPSIGVVTYDGSGSFSASYKLPVTSFTSGSGPIDCTKVQCVIGSTNGNNPADRSYNATAEFSVGAAPAKAKITKLKVKKHANVLVKWRAAKANGAPVTKYVVQVKKAKKDWKRAGATAPGKHKLVWKKGKHGKTYKFRVLAKSAAGTSKSKAKKITV